MTSSEAEPLQFFIQGKQDAKTAVVFFQGWPDNNTVWDPLDWKQNLKDHRLVFINFPNTSPTQPLLKWGQDFPEIVQRMKVTVDKTTLGCSKKLMVAHDWGCTYGYFFDHTFPNYFNELITLDIPGMVDVVGFLPKIYVVVYQFLLATAFLIGGLPGRLITQAVVKIFKYNPKHFAEINASRNYPYFYFIKNLLRTAFNKPKAYLYRYRPSVPVVYIYGSVKPLHYHGARWENYLKETAKCEIHRFECGHWIMNNYGQDVAEIIARRIKGL